MDFDKQKKDVLKKLSEIDKSKKGCVDSDILSLITKINKLNDYYTTSSCSGRIMLMDKGLGRKDLAEWLLSSHSTITVKEFNDVFSKSYLSSEKFKKAVVWFMEEPAILHICCRDLNSAKKLLDMSKKIPFKRSGIFSFSKRIIVEILDTEKMETLVAKNGILYVKDDYAKIIVDEANSKLKNTKNKLKKFEKQIKELN
jgi:tRNA wybutosine-synthesizing protein 3